MKLDISLAPETIFHLGSLPVTNTLLWSYFLTAMIIVFVLFLRRFWGLVPNTWQNIAELLVDEGYKFVESVIGSAEKARRVFSLVFTMFIYTALANLASFIPGQSAITLQRDGGAVPLFRSVMSDYGQVFMMTIIVVITVQVVAIAVNGPFGYLGKFFNFKSPLKFFLGLMDLVGEMAKILSLSFRLFGNIFAGEVLTAVMLYLSPFFVPLPFMFLGLLSAVVQAFVFSVLTLVFISLASEIEMPDGAEAVN